MVKSSLMAFPCKAIHCHANVTQLLNHSDQSTSQAIARAFEQITTIPRARLHDLPLLLSSTLLQLLIGTNPQRLVLWPSSLAKLQVSCFKHAKVNQCEKSSNLARGGKSHDNTKRDTHLFAPFLSKRRQLANTSVVFVYYQHQQINKGSRTTLRGQGRSAGR
jgi:hypothetical protein